MRGSLELSFLVVEVASLTPRSCLEAFVAEPEEVVVLMRIVLH